MINIASDLSVTSKVPPVALPEGTVLYFDARMSRPTVSSLQRDARPIPALEQMFAYYEA